jgi:hypothetical protein
MMATLLMVSSRGVVVVAGELWKNIPGKQGKVLLALRKLGGLGRNTARIAAERNNGYAWQAKTTKKSHHSMDG